MQIIFRCYNCESLNEIPITIKYRFCKKCGKIITYTTNEAILNDANQRYTQFVNLKKLDNDLAKKFFRYAEEDADKIEQIIIRNTPQSEEWIDIPDGSLIESIIYLLKNSKIQSLDELIRKSEAQGIPLEKLEKILVKMRGEGLIFQPTSWSIKLV